MKATMTFECGTKTCASEPGVFCRFIRTEVCGTRYRCTAFEEPLYDGPLGQWLQRCTQCLAECGTEWDSATCARKE